MIETAILNEPDRIAFRGDLGDDVMLNNVARWGDATPEEHAAFEELFEHLGEQNHTDGDTYQGTTFMVVVRRKSDGRLFGFDYWQGGGKHGEAFYDEGSTADHDLNTYDPDSYEPIETWRVFLPVEAHWIPAYRFPK